MEKIKALLATTKEQLNVLDNERDPITGKLYGSSLEGEVSRSNIYMNFMDQVEKIIEGE